MATQKKKTNVRKSSKIRKGDKVQVIRGKYRGETVTVERIMLGQGRVEIEGAGLAPVKKHLKPGKDPKREEGGIIEMRVSVDLSNVAIIDPSSGKPSKIGIKRLEDGKKARIAKRSGEVLS